MPARTPKITAARALDTGPCFGIVNDAGFSSGGSAPISGYQSEIALLGGSHRHFVAPWPDASHILSAAPAPTDARPTGFMGPVHEADPGLSHNMTLCAERLLHCHAHRL